MINNDLAVILRSRNKVCDLKRSIEDLFEEDILFKGSDLIDRVNNILASDVSHSLIYLFLELELIITKQRKNDIKDYRFKGDKKKFNDYMVEQIKIASILEDIEIEIRTQEMETVDVLATFPDDDEFQDAFPEGIKSLYPSLRMLIISAQRSLTVINPYFDPNATTPLAYDLSNAANRGVNVKIITREALVNKPNNALHTSLNIIYDAFEGLGVGDKLEIRDYYKTCHDTSRQISAIHSKMLLVDDNACYLGSANITTTSLYSNFETGVILKGERVKPICEIINRLWTISSIVSKENIT